MLFYLLGIFLFGSVQTLTIGHPYRTLLSYDSTHSAGKVIVPQGLLIYIDNRGVERIVSYNFAQPVYAIRRINFINADMSTRQNLLKDDSSEINKAREAHFRAWSLQQYQVLKREIDCLRGEGKEPTIEMALKFLPLEKIALTSDFSTIADLPEIKHIQEEHLKIWKQVLQTDEDQIEDKTNTITTKMPMKELEFQQQNSNVNNKQFSSEDKSAKDQFNTSKIFGEVKNLTLESSGLADIEKPIPVENIEEAQRSKTSTSEAIKGSEDNQKIVAKNENHDIDINERNSSQKQQTFDTEVIKAYQDHRNLVMAAKEQNMNIHSQVEKRISAAPPIYVPQQVVDTVEVMRARDEHLKIVHEALQKAKLAQQQLQEQQKKNITKIPDIAVHKKDIESLEL